MHMLRRDLRTSQPHNRFKKVKKKRKENSIIPKFSLWSWEQGCKAMTSRHVPHSRLWTDGFLISDFWFLISVFRFPFFDFLFSISHVGCRMSDVGCRMSDVGFRISDFGFRISDFLSPAIYDICFRQSENTCHQFLGSDSWYSENGLPQSFLIIIDPKPYQSTHFIYIYIYAIENSPMDLSRHRQILSNVSRGEKLREGWIIVEGLRPRKIDFPRTRNYLHRLSKYIKWLFARQCIWFISLVILVNEGDSSRPAPTRVHVPFDTVFNQIW